MAYVFSFDTDFTFNMFVDNLVDWILLTGSMILRFASEVLSSVITAKAIASHVEW